MCAYFVACSVFLQYLTDCFYWPASKKYTQYLYLAKITLILHFVNLRTLKTIVTFLLPRQFIAQRNVQHIFSIATYMCTCANKQVTYVLLNLRVVVFCCAGGISERYFSLVIYSSPFKLRRNVQARSSWYLRIGQLSISSLIVCSPSSNFLYIHSKQIGYHASIKVVLNGFLGHQMYKYRYTPKQIVCLISPT